LLEDLLYILGAFIGFSVSFVSFHGYRDIGSPAMLRLAIAFLLLGGGFFLSGLVGLSDLGILQIATLVLSGIVFVAYSLEAAGYFFLAFSHMMNVRGFGKANFAQKMTLTAAIPLVGIKSISIYFLLYGVFETTIAYFRERRSETLIIALGLGLIASAEFIRWVSLLYPTVSTILVFSLVIKIIGLSTFGLPVVRFVSSRRRTN